MTSPSKLRVGLPRMAFYGDKASITRYFTLIVLPLASKLNFFLSVMWHFTSTFFLNDQPENLGSL